MSMDRKRVQFLLTNGSRGKGDFALLPHAEIALLISQGVVKLAPEVKPAGPPEIKPAAPVQVKK